MGQRRPRNKGTPSRLTERQANWLEHLRAYLDLGEWDGMAIGGLSVGESKDDMWRILEALHPLFGLIPILR